MADTQRPKHGGAHFAGGSSSAGTSSRPASARQDRSLSKLKPGQGAVRPGSATRSERSRSPEAAHPTSKVLVAVVAACVVVLIAVIALFVGLLNSGAFDTETNSLVEQQQVDTSTSIEYGGYTYQVGQQDDGTYALTRTAEGSSTPTVAATLDGEPVTLILHNGTFYIPENTDAGWDVVSYTMGDGSVPIKLSGEDGKDLGGTNTLSDAALDGDTLVLTEDGGETQRIELASGN